uniref:Uncharacterized protein n=1 Tax=Populus davidiana TaxID=266767 RepID=A0A6M2F7R2_9ROSI
MRLTFPKPLVSLDNTNLSISFPSRYTSSKLIKASSSVTLNDPFSWLYSIDRDLRDERPLMNDKVLSLKRLPSKTSSSRFLNLSKSSPVP